VAGDSDGQTLAASPPAPVENSAPGRSSHALAEAVFVVALPVAGLVGALHLIVPYLNGKKSERAVYNRKPVETY
jgi:hypothetical protein